MYTHFNERKLFMLYVNTKFNYTSQFEYKLK